jgi:DNA-binding GntR family transcriptional regulator
VREIGTASAEPRTLSDAAFVRLRSDIVSGELRPGAKLKIADLVTRYDVGASPLREALARLSAEHLVVLEGQRGFTVAPVSRQELEDLSHVRQLVEGDAVVRSVEQGDVEWEARIVAAYFRLQRAHQASAARSFTWSPEWERCNQEFHAAVVAACDSPWLIRVQRSLYTHSERYRHIAFVSPQVSRDGDAEHKAIMDACLARKPELARRLTVEHIARTAATVAALLSTGRQAAGPSRAMRLLAEAVPAGALEASRKKRRRTGVRTNATRVRQPRRAGGKT